MSAKTAGTSDVALRYEFQAPYWHELMRLWERRGAGEYRGVYWFGAAGTGKTFLARQFSRHRQIGRVAAGEHDRACRVFIGGALELVAETQAAMNRKVDARTLHEMIQEIKRADVVFLDDLGREREDYGQSVMFTLLDTALSRSAFVVVTANRDAKGLADYYQGDAGLRSRLSPLKQVEWPPTLPNLRKPERGGNREVRDGTQDKNTSVGQGSPRLGGRVRKFSRHENL